MTGLRALNVRCKVCHAPAGHGCAPYGKDGAQLRVSLAPHRQRLYDAAVAAGGHLAAAEALPRRATRVVSGATLDGSHDALAGLPTEQATITGHWAGGR